jgi:hypothetical protein
LEGVVAAEAAGEAVEAVGARADLDKDDDDADMDAFPLTCPLDVGVGLKVLGTSALTAGAKRGVGGSSVEPKDTAEARGRCV